MLVAWRGVAWRGAAWRGVARLAGESTLQVSSYANGLSDGCLFTPNECMGDHLAASPFIDCNISWMVGRCLRRDVSSGGVGEGASKRNELRDNLQLFS